MTLAFNNFLVFVFFKVFLGLSFAMFYTVVVLMEKKLSYGFRFA